MIAQRFRALGWVTVVASAATGLYLVSLQVAAERGKLEAVERSIVSAQREMRQLQTELGTRASMRQLERWNGDVLALSAPKASQYLKNETQLAALNYDGARATPNTPPVALASATVNRPAAQEVPGVRNATFIKPVAAPRLERIAMLDVAVARTASTEDRKRP